MRGSEGEPAVITGAASGIGRALAERAAQEGMNALLADIEESALDHSPHEGLSGHHDVSSRTRVDRETPFDRSRKSAEKVAAWRNRFVLEFLRSSRGETR
jgi:NAD(P)-dependent dehydrogenase (short-subunit alcohol dehydrogenase family)